MGAGVERRMCLMGGCVGVDIRMQGIVGCVREMTKRGDDEFL